MTLYGKYGHAEFDGQGGGWVLWNSESTLPGETTKFDERTRVCLS